MKKFKWFFYIVVALIVISFTGSDVIAFSNKKSKAKLGFFLFGLKKLPHIKMATPIKDKVTKVRSQELTVPMNGTYRFYKTAEVFNIKRDNWFYDKGLRSGDFIMNILLTYNGKTDYFDIDNLLLVSLYDIVDAGYEMCITVFRVTEWTDKDNLISSAVKVVPLTIKKGR